ncbi:MAG TPA: GNAT family N-acetyltransferase [Candidatus Acidoferrales bacterium]|nr:GNAT family N-acetyltransferase [Candidatus Acidoferrales bacterium]
MRKRKGKAKHRAEPTEKKECFADQNLTEDFTRHLFFEPVTKGNWDKFVDLFGEKGACGNCWCMYYRAKKTDFVKGKIKNGNRDAMKKIVWSGRPVGLLAIYGHKAIAWLALAPREDFLKLESSRVHKRIDQNPVWAIPCTFIHKDYRRHGVSVALLKGAIEYAKSVGIKILEAYPVIPTQKKWPDSFLWVGIQKSFARAGFEIVDTTSRSRPMMRYYVDKRVKKSAKRDS